MQKITLKNRMWSDPIPIGSVVEIQYYNGNLGIVLAKGVIYYTVYSITAQEKVELHPTELKLVWNPGN